MNFYKKQSLYILSFLSCATYHSNKAMFPIIKALVNLKNNLQSTKEQTEKNQILPKKTKQSQPNTQSHNKCQHEEHTLTMMTFHNGQKTEINFGNYAANDPDAKQAMYQKLFNNIASQLNPNPKS